MNWVDCKIGIFRSQRVCRCRFRSLKAPIRVIRHPLASACVTLGHFSNSFLYRKNPQLRCWCTIIVKVFLYLMLRKCGKLLFRVEVAVLSLNSSLFWYVTVCDCRKVPLAVPVAVDVWVRDSNLNPIAKLFFLLDY